LSYRSFIPDFSEKPLYGSTFKIAWADRGYFRQDKKGWNGDHIIMLVDCPAAARTHAKRRPGSEVLLRGPSFEACAAGRNLSSLILPLFSRIGAMPLLFSGQSFAALLRPFCWPPAEMFSDIRRFTELDTNVFDTPSTTVRCPASPPTQEFCGSRQL
jgi:hypothetical protein